MIVVIGQNRYDTPHAIAVSKIIKKQAPDIVALELPKGFQKIVDRFQEGKLKEKDLDMEFGKLVGRSIEIDENLLEKLEKKKLEALDLSEFTPDGAFIHMIIAANRVGAKVLAVDVRLDEIEKEIEKSLDECSRESVLKKVRAHSTMPSKGVLFFGEVVHAPFHFLELILGHNPHKDPFNHPAKCRVCKLGVKWERFWHSLLAHATNLIPSDHAKHLYILHRYDRIRERKMAEAIANASKGKKKVLAVVHTWHEIPIEKELERLGKKVQTLYV